MNKMENPYTRVLLLRQSKFLKSLFLASFAFIVTLILSSCEYLHEPVRDYFEKWTNKVSIEKYEINNVEFYEDKDGNVCIGSDQDAYVSLFMLNPYHYDFNSPEFSSKITSVQNETAGSSSLSFPDIIPDASDTTHLHLTYAKEFLKAYEGGHDIGAVITVEHPYNSGEKNEYTLNVKCNSKPPVINYGAVMQNNNTYFLCFNIAPSYISDIHTDIKQIVIDDGTNIRTSECHVESDGTIVLDSPDSLSKTSPGTLTAAGPGASFSPDSTNAFYFSSGIAVEADREMSFTITLIDEAGLSSSTVISTASRQLEAPRAWDSVADIELVPSTTTSVINTLVLGSNYEGLINLSIPIQTINGDPVSGVQVYYKLKKNNTSSTSGGNRTEYENHDITVSETGEHQLQVWAEKEGYVNSATVTYTIKIRPLVITFHKNDGTTATATQEVSRGAGVTLKSLRQLGLERTGYTFDGWKESEDSADEYNNAQENVSFNRDIDLYAYWTAITSTLSFDKNGGTGTANAITVTYDSTYPTLPTVRKTGHSYKWLTDGGQEIKAGDTVRITQPTTLTASWTANNYTVTFNAYGGNFSGNATTTKQETYGQKYVLPSDPEREGYEFKGWFTNTNYNTEVTTNTDVQVTNNNQILYAKWALCYYFISDSITYGTISETSDGQQGSKHGYGKTVTVTVTPDNVHGLYDISIKNDTTDQEIETTPWIVNGNVVTMTFTMPASSVTITPRIRNAYKVKITPYNDSGSIVKNNCKNKTVRIWIVDDNASYDSQYKEVTLDDNAEYDGYICYPNNKTSLVHARLGAITVLGAYGDDHGFAYCNSFTGQADLVMSIMQIRFKGVKVGNQYQGQIYSFRGVNNAWDYAQVAGMIDDIGFKAVWKIYNFLDEDTTLLVHTSQLITGITYDIDSAYLITGSLANGVGGYVKICNDVTLYPNGTGTFTYP